MFVDVRMYKRYDLDLIALCDAGYPLSKLYMNALISYANCRPCALYIDELPLFSASNAKSPVRVRFDIKDKETIKMLKNIKPGYRNSFCKMVLRNALEVQNLNCYFKSEKFFHLTSACQKNKHYGEHAHPTIVLSEYDPSLTDYMKPPVPTEHVPGEKIVSQPKFLKNMDKGQSEKKKKDDTSINRNDENVNISVANNSALMNMFSELAD